ncbi:hypothetical protein KVR01_007083 [Diaporthe batatas]|uniref:uncharacterized protein n=1 Tax=Diaporthe batatas TaxID=748121 RepID=UPI001D056654|nr:uncharacterized protein KVR01_007083 [Diaporthe batatas]KAG8163786.1 hypothetical protein KVR01_007083 [Diaporthe batatas]
MPIKSNFPFLPLRSTPEEDEEEAPFKVCEDRFLPAAQRVKSHGILSLTRVYMILLHLLVIFLWTRSWSYVDADAIKILQRYKSWSPIQSSVEYEINAEHATDHRKFSKYSGPPREELEHAWGALIRPLYFNASYEELRRGGESLENLAAVKGGGYAATIGVYHELHCLRQLRFYLFRDKYYPNLTLAQDLYLHGHLDHCLETLRLTIMCHGNTGLYSFAWDDPNAPQPATKSNSRSVCAKWSSIEEWAISRTPHEWILEGKEGHIGIAHVTPHERVD